MVTQYPLLRTEDKCDGGRLLNRSRQPRPVKVAWTRQKRESTFFPLSLILSPSCSLAPPLAHPSHAPLSSVVKAIPHGHSISSSEPKTSTTAVAPSIVHADPDSLEALSHTVTQYPLLTEDKYDGGRSLNRSRQPRLVRSVSRLTHFSSLSRSLASPLAHPSRAPLSSVVKAIPHGHSISSSANRRQVAWTRQKRESTRAFLFPPLAHSLPLSPSHLLACPLAHSLAFSLTRSPSPSLARPLPHSLALSLTRSPSPSLARPLPHSLALSLTRSPSPSLARPLPHSLALSLTRSPSPSLARPLPHSLALSLTRSPSPSLARPLTPRSPSHPLAHPLPYLLLLSLSPCAPLSTIEVIHGVTVTQYPLLRSNHIRTLLYLLIALM
ncbi:hypothetical protein EDB83DRAFT_2524233 [Lactarius deliciosus]|nr:hypothetical protein EDB83DRAFT_2524233 [Lactarius deliciosus]